MLSALGWILYISGTFLIGLSIGKMKKPINNGGHRDTTKAAVLKITPAQKRKPRKHRKPWSRARAREHLIDYLKAIAALENRKEVKPLDYELLAGLLRPMALETISITKEQLEGERSLNNNLLALLTEYYSYGGQFSLAHVAMDYKLSVQQVYKIMAKQNGYWQQIGKTPSVYEPSKALVAILEKYKLEFEK